MGCRRWRSDLVLSPVLLAWQGAPRSSWLSAVAVRWQVMLSLTVTQTKDEPFEVIFSTLVGRLNL